MYFNRINEQLLMFLLNVFRSQSEKEDQLLVAKHRWKTDFICLTLSSVRFSFNLDHLATKTKTTPRLDYRCKAEFRFNSQQDTI